MTAQDHLSVVEGALAIIDERARQLGQRGLAVWTDASRAALDMERRRRREGMEKLQRALDQLAVTSCTSRAQLFIAIERANAAVAGAMERLALIAVLVAVMGAGATADDNLARRAPRGRSRRRDECVMILDGETGELL